MPSPFTLSDLLGYASIGCWLGAQFPQVIENIRRQSCEGLALPFLANWLLGDISNLVGCILTNQLPFQKWLATYFVIVDLTLVAQYFYYYRPPAKVIPGYGHVRVPTTPSTTIRRLSVDRGHSRYRTLSAVAANVSAAAAWAAHQEEQERPRSTRTARPPSYGTDEIRSGLLTTSPTYDDQESDDDGVGALADSFHSEGGRIRRKRTAWAVERRSRGSSVGRYPPTLPPTTPTALHVLPHELVHREAESTHHQAGLSTHSESESDAETVPASRRNSRASRRGATMVFLGTWALFGIGTFAGNKRGMATPSRGVGRLLFPPEALVPMVSPQQIVPTPVSPVLASVTVPTTDHFVPQPPPQRRSSEPDSFEDPESIDEDEDDEDDEEDRHPIPPHKPHPEDPDFERVLGRIFAWLCTTLYLTSRLPQIWKNYVRKSVEGLSMYLFVFAFLGNTFYVASILSSPKAYLPPPISTEFFRESFPYLLGSGGTLLFDVTIVTQSFIYRPKSRRHLSVARLEEEAAGLLSPELSAGESAILNRGRTLRTRSAGP